MIETEGPLEKAVLFYTGSAIFYANSYEECLKFTADDKIERDSQAHAYYEVLYNEVIFGEVYDGIIKVWWYVAPTIINTFLEAYDFSGKTIILFATSGGSGMGNSAKELRPSVSDSAVIKDGKRFSANASVSELKEWVNSFGI